MLLCFTVVEKPEGRKQPEEIEAGQKFGVISSNKIFFLSELLMECTCFCFMLFMLFMLFICSES